MNKYFKDLHSFYESKDTVYNPTLALYVKDTLLKFQSCIYVSKGISNASALNPRYFNSQFDREGEELVTSKSAKSESKSINDDDIA